jgi:hypothetical protein
MTINRTALAALGTSALVLLILALTALDRAEHWRTVALTACGVK